MSSRRIVLISRLSTQNAGNEALSKELIRYTTEECPQDDVFALDRYPRYFEQFSLDSLGPDIIDSFDKLARKLLAKFNKSDTPLPAKANISVVRLERNAKELKGFLRDIKRKVGIRRRLAAWGIIEKDAAPMFISTCASADLVVWNPAGEIHPTGNPDQVFRILLLIRIAQISGKKTAVINHSLEITDERLKCLIQHVYTKMDYVGVRDATSVKVAKDIGVSSNLIHESPDLVFLASRHSKPDCNVVVPKGAIALAINGLEANQGTDEWDAFLADLNKLDRPILLLSNAVNHDLSFAREIENVCPKAVVIDYQPGYEELRAYYSQCSVLVSSRLHASILAMCEGVPVISIEPSVFKLTAIFQQLGYPIQTECLRNSGWSARVIKTLQRCLGPEGTSIAIEGTNRIADQTQRIDNAFKPLFALLN